MFGMFDTENIPTTAEELVVISVFSIWQLLAIDDRFHEDGGRI